jgi:hypothetical protein
MGDTSLFPVCANGGVPLGQGSGGGGAAAAEAPKQQPLVATGIEISEDESNAPIKELLLAVLGVDPLCAAIVGFVGRPAKPVGPSFYDMGHPRRLESIPIAERLSVRQFSKSKYGSISDLLARDLVEKIELTQDANMGGAYYRAYFRFREPDHMQARAADSRVTPSSACIYELVPYGGPPDNDNAPAPGGGAINPRWKLPFSGPSLAKLPICAVYRLSSGALFDLSTHGAYQRLYTRRSIYG